MHMWELMLAKLIELKGWITPHFHFMTLGDNFYGPCDGCTGFMITQDQKYPIHWVTGTPREKTQVAFILFDF